MNAFKTFALNHIPKETTLSVLYGTIIFAGTVFILKRIFGRKKPNKKYYEKNRKKVCTRSKIFFNDLSKKFEVKPKSILIKEEEQLINNDKYFKMKQFVQKVAYSIEKSNLPSKKDKEDKLEKFRSRSNSQDESSNKKDQIFYYLLNNVSHMITQANCNR